MTTWVKVLVCMGVLLSPATAHAEWFVFPFAASNTGGDTTRSSLAVGGSAGWIGSWLGIEGEVAVSPSFFDDADEFRSEHRQTTYTATGLFTHRMNTWRPYAALGIGVVQSRIEEIGGLATLSDDRPALHAGGGVMWDAMPRIGVRGDVRYIRALDGEEAEGNVFTESLADFGYWRLGVGATVRW